MTSKNPKSLITLDNKLIEKVDDFRFENRIPSCSEAIRKLLNEALNKYEKKGNK